MITTPRLLRHALLAITAMAVTHGVSADILFESAERGTPPSGFLQLQGSEGGMAGVRFSLSTEMQITAVGGIVTSTGDMFAAIVPLPSPTPLPTGSVEEVAVVHAVFSSSNTSSDTLVPVDVILPAGDYAIVLGVGAFGANGQNANLRRNNVAFPETRFMGGNQFGWFDFEQREYRVVVEGFSTADLDGDGVDVGVDNCAEVSNPDQTDSDGDGFGNACDADLNNDCIVNVADLGILRSRFFSADPDADFDGDGAVNIVDLGIMRAAFFSEPGPGSATNICSVPVRDSGEFMLSQTWSFDLDDFVAQGLLAPPSDVFYQAQTSTVKFFRPLNGARIALYGTTEPTLLDCETVTLSETSVSFNDLEVGSWLCLTTDEGRLAKFSVIGANGDTVVSSTLLTIGYTTWEN